MRYGKHAAKLLGLAAVAALGAMALAASAQAVAPGFLINLESVGTLKATFSGEQVGRGALLVPGLNFEINCEKFTVDEGLINSSTDAKSILLYTECTTLSIPKESPEEIHCHVAEPIKAEALILPAEILSGAAALLAEKIKALIRLWLPNAAKPLTEECILPNDNVVTGEICLRLDGNNSSILEVLTSQAISGECKERKTLEALGEDIGGGFKDKLKYGAQEVFVDGTARLSLTGVHKGLFLGVCLF